ncbi:MAG: FAD-dependent oxidoreductase, partial [Planctomycetota bacterium]|nr:FAD-dependent oxidoreductase [Planctomycetota bacterium]
MLREKPTGKRSPAAKTIRCDLAVIGGGLAGVCCAVTAARAGIDVALVQDRPVLGGNASSEVRMVALGATASMANNNRWAREGGVIDEFLVENAYRNPEGNSLISDTILLEMVAREPHIRLLLDTAVFDAETSNNTIDFARAFCPQNSTLYEIHAPLFCDASGDGILGYLAGAAFRMGAESADEHGEPLAPSADYGELLGHTIYFQSIDTGRSVRFVPPAFALEDITKISRWERISPAEQGCQYWWLEYGGRLDTIHESQAIKWELWRIVYGIWNHIKNSGRFPEAENLTLEWVGSIPGKRESRRFEGDYILAQSDVVTSRDHHDTVSYGGWSMDLHPADGLYADHAACSQWHAKGVFPIPFRSMYSRNVGNLLLAGRIISASHVAFGATRVMATCAHGAQAVGMAAALCRRENISPAGLADPGRVDQLRQDLARAGQYMPGYRLEDPQDLARAAKITATSRLQLDKLEPDGPLQPLVRPWAVLVPLAAGRVPRFTFQLDVDAPTRLELQMRTSLEPDTYTPEVVRATRCF